MWDLWDLWGKMWEMWEKMWEMWEKMWEMWDRKKKMWDGFWPHTKAALGINRHDSSQQKTRTLSRCSPRQLLCSSHPHSYSSSKQQQPQQMKLTHKELSLLHRGLQWIGFDRRAQKLGTLLRRFKSLYTEGPIAISKLFDDCKREMPKFKEKYAFMAVMWLTTYAKETDLAGRFKCCEKTVEKKCKEYCKLFQSFKDAMVRFSGFDERVYQYDVDCQNYDTYEFRMSPSTKWYNHKSHSSGVKYEYAVHLWESRLVSMRGPLPCGVNDISMYKGGDKGNEHKDRSALYFEVKGKIYVYLAKLFNCKITNTCFRNAEEKAY